MMTPEEFTHHIDTHGPDLHYWPAEVQTDAREFANTAAGRMQLDHARAFDTLLADSLHAPRPMGLKARILANIANPAPGTRPIDLIAWLRETLWRPLTVAITPLLMGFVIGVAFPETDDALEDTISLLVSSEITAEYEEISNAE
jgi:hypothetical protein